MNNIELMNYWMLQSCIDDACRIVKSRDSLIKLDKQKLQSYKDDLKGLQDKLNESKKIKKINNKINKFNNKIQKLQSKSYKIILVVDFYLNNVASIIYHMMNLNNYQ